VTLPAGASGGTSPRQTTVPIFGQRGSTAAALPRQLRVDDEDLRIGLAEHVLELAGCYWTDTLTSTRPERARRRTPPRTR
jgi:hypothetical protein